MNAATQVSGGNAVNISSGRNLTLNGATIEANRVTADVGGDLNITTLQDVSVGQSRQSSSGFGVSLCIPPICYGAVATVSANSAGAKADGVFISPAVQSGIKAGDGGFDVNVGGNTNLRGAVIESTQAAIDAGRNSFHTGGALTMSDLQNVSQSNGSSYAVGGSRGHRPGSGHFFVVGECAAVPDHPPTLRRTATPAGTQTRLGDLVAYIKSKGL